MAGVTPGAGYWAPDARGGAWQWHATTQPIPQNLIDKYGMDAITNHNGPPGDPDRYAPKPPGPDTHTTPTAPDHNPVNPATGQPYANDPTTGKPYAMGGGYWAPTRGGGKWTWMNANGAVTVVPVGGYTYEELTNPDHKPGEAAPHYDKDGNLVGTNQQYTGEYLQGDYNGDGMPDKNPNYVAPDVNAPTVTVKSGWPKDLTGDVPPPPEGQGPTEAKAPPSHPAYSVDGAAILQAEQSILTPAGTAATTYNELVSHVASTKWWVFSAPSPEALNVQSGHTTVVYDPNSAITNQLSSASDNLLLNVADAIHAAGAYVEAIDAAGQMYSKADQNSFVPET